MTNAGLAPGIVDIDYSFGDDFDLAITVSGVTLSTSAATLVVRNNFGSGATTLKTFSVANGLLSVNAGTGVLTITETAANMTSALPTTGHYPYWLQMTDSDSNELTVLRGKFNVLEAHQS